MGAGLDTVGDLSPVRSECLMRGFQNTSTVWIFFLAMMLNQDIQAKAQEEFDNVVGEARLPTAQDKVSLPYTYQERHDRGFTMASCGAFGHVIG
jgi:hypothetical protein